MPPITADQLYVYCRGLLLWNLQKQKESVVLYKNIEPDIIILLCSQVAATYKLKLL